MIDEPIYRLAAELARELAEQRELNVALAERLTAASQVLGRCAEKGKFCPRCGRELT